MRGGGGRGGRGRGRFGRGGGGASQDLIRDNLEDLGLEYGDIFKKNENNLDSSLGGDPASYTLYPTIDMVPPPNVQTLSEKQIYLIQYNNILQSRCQDSPCFVSTTIESKDIERRSDLKKRAAPTVGLYDYIMTQYNGLQVEANKFIPPELLDSRALSGLKPTQQKSKAARITKGMDEATLQKLEQAEKTGGGTDNVAKEDEEEDAENEGEAEEVDDFELDDDYGVDHYASDNEAGGGDGDMDGGDGGDF
mmetsp:Transcript_8649/g.12899  ORF Transcript_8649/g.12899 Transcript_8649/m.12899 type:complete len:250 (+) Transcript_8649:15-764(+)